VTCGSSVDFLGTLISSTNKTDGHDIIEIFLIVALNTLTITLTNPDKNKIPSIAHALGGSFIIFGIFRIVIHVGKILEGALIYFF
jgi:hypothetical protein